MSSSSLGWKVVTYLSFTLLLLSTVMNMYALFGDKYFDIYFGYLAIFLYLFLKAVKVKTDSRELYIPRELKLFFFYTCIISLLTNLNSFNGLLSLLTIIIVILSYVVYWDTYRNTKFIRFYITIAVIAVAFLFFQYIVKGVTGVGVSGVIPGLPTSKGLAEDVVYNRQFEYDRFPSFFSEPSHLAQFLIPLLIVLLFDYTINIKRRKQLIIAIITSLVLLKAGTALLLLIPSIVIFAFLFWKKNKNKPVVSFIVIPLLVLGSIAIGAWYLSSEMGSLVEERSAEVYNVSSDDKGTSGFVRIWRGYFVYNDFNLEEMIFGNDSYDDIVKHVYHSNMQLYLEDFALTYFNGIQFILIHYGLIGLLLFLYFLFKLWRNNTVCGKCLLVTLLLLMLIESVFGTARMATFLLLAQYQKLIFRNGTKTSICNI